MAGRSAQPRPRLGYLRFGRPPHSPTWLQEQARSESPGKSGSAFVAAGVSHCGAGRTLGDIVAEFTVFTLRVTLFAASLLAEYVGDYLLAVTLACLAFQYFTIAPMRGPGWAIGLSQRRRPMSCR